MEGGDKGGVGVKKKKKYSVHAEMQESKVRA